MKLILEVGEIEKHIVEFKFNQLLGNLVIRVDSEPILNSTRLINEPVYEVFNFVVGQKEKAAVRIEQLLDLLNL